MPGNIDIYTIHKRFTYTKSMVDLVNVPNVRYNQGLQGLSAIIGGSVSTERPSVPSGLIVFLLLRVPGSPWASLGIPGPPLGFPWASLGFPGAPWASLGVPGCTLAGAPWASRLWCLCSCWASLGLPGPPWASLGLPGPPWISLGFPGRPWVHPCWGSLGLPSLLFVFVLGLPGFPGAPWASLGHSGPPGVVAKAVQIPRMCSVLTL